jgi:hypothetical protein
MLNKNKIIKGEMKCGAQSKKRLNIKLGASVGLENIRMVSINAFSKCAHK